jgi:hypothetical protein
MTGEVHKNVITDLQTKAVLEEQIHDQDIEVSKAKNAAKKKQDQATDLEEELMDYRKV